MMQKRVKGLLVAGVVLSAVGIGLFAIGAGTGGIAYVGAADLNKMDGNAKRKNGAIQEKTELARFDRIDASFGDANLRILPSDDDTYYLAYEFYGSEEEEPLEYAVENGTLTMADRVKNGTYFQVDISFISELLGKAEPAADNVVTLYVPESAVFADSKIKVGDGDLELEGFNCKRAELDMSYGDLKLRDCTLEDSVIDSADGEVEADGLTCTRSQIGLHYGNLILTDALAADCIVELADGDLAAEGLAVSGNLEISNSYGDVDLQLARTADSTISAALKTEYGKIDLGEPFEKCGRLTEGDDKAEYTFEAEQEEGSLKVSVSDGNIALK